MWYLRKMLAFEDIFHFHMKVKGFQLWHLWQVLTLEDIFSYFTIENVLYAIFVKNTSLCMHIFLFHERDKSIKCDIYGKYWLCIHILSFHDETNFQMWCLWKILAFLCIFPYFKLEQVFQTWYLWKMLAIEDMFLYYMTGSCLSVVMFVENISLWRHIF